jgi:hypothetical protein
MKHFVYSAFSALIVCAGVPAVAQNNALKQAPAAIRSIKVNRPVHKHSLNSEMSTLPLQASNPIVQAPSAARGFGPEVKIGQTLYDLQTNNSINYRIENFGDGTLSAIWNFSGQSTVGWTDRGMAYHQFDGSAWTKLPEYGLVNNITRVEDVRTGFGSLARVQGVGDIIVAHQTEIDALQISRNTTESDENWIQSPRADMPLIWPRMRVGGPDGKTVHIIALTEPSGGTFTGTPFNGINGALLYNRSTDGGQTFDKLMVQLPNVDSTIFASFGGDSYALDAKGNTVAFVAGDLTSRVEMWKSIDNGETWTSRTVLAFPYEPWDEQLTDLDTNGIVEDTETIDVSDGSFAILIDNNDKVHVWFGAMRMLNDDAGDNSVSYFPGTNGIRYWNEDFAIDSLPETILGAMDDNGDDSLDVAIRFSNGTTVPYGSGLSGYPSAGIDANGTLYLSYAALKEGSDYLYLGEGPSFRHLYLSKSTDGGTTWTDAVDVVGDEFAGFDQFAEYMYCSIARKVDDNVHMLYQRDFTPGSAVTIDNASIHPFDLPNDIVYMSVTKEFNTVGINPTKNEVEALTLMPNPANETATISFNVATAGVVNIRIINMLGQDISRVSSSKVAPGMQNITLGTSELPSGIYLVNVTSGNQNSSLKMIVKH